MYVDYIAYLLHTVQPDKMSTVVRTLRVRVESSPTQRIWPPNDKTERALDVNQASIIFNVLPC